jgi:hypothetical protein
MSIPTPSLRQFLAPYKIASKALKRELGISLTDAQHRIAKSCGYDDWQSFNYFFKSLADLDLGLSRQEWLYFAEMLNGLWLQDHFPFTTDFLRFNVIESDIWSALGATRFQVLSEYNKETGEYHPSDRMKELIAKITKFSDVESQSVLFTCLMFWGKPHPKLQGSDALNRCVEEAFSSLTPLAFEVENNLS